jgi:hypothetical protein
MARAAVELLSDQRRWEQTRARCVERARMFSAERIVSLYEAMYRQVVAQ